MDDALLVRGAQALGDLDCEVDCLTGGELAAGELGAKRFALKQLLDDVGRALVRSDVVDDGDVGVVEDPRGFGLLLEAAEAVGVLREGRWQDLDRDLAAQARVFRPIHLPHPASAERREDLVGTHTRARRVCQRILFSETLLRRELLERETGIEPATSTLARWRSTA